MLIFITSSHKTRARAPVHTHTHRYTHTYPHPLWLPDSKWLAALWPIYNNDYTNTHTRTLRNTLAPNVCTHAQTLKQAYKRRRTTYTKAHIRRNEHAQYARTHTRMHARRNTKKRTCVYPRLYIISYISQYPVLLAYKTHIPHSTSEHSLIPYPYPKSDYIASTLHPYPSPYLPPSIPQPVSHHAPCAKLYPLPIPLYPSYPTRSDFIST